uniref:Uncharacterized protein n=2 Tax=Oryza TaxID=4527 RepID=A0A0D3H4A6_9ORYZ
MRTSDAHGGRRANGGAVKVMAAASQWTTFLVPVRPARVDLLPGNAGCRPSWLDLPALRRAWDNRSWCDFAPVATTNLNLVNFDALLACAIQQMSLMVSPNNPCIIEDKDDLVAEDTNHALYLQGTSACTVYLSRRSYCEGGDISLQASVKVLKEVTKTRKVPVLEVPLALTKIKKANLETSSFFETLRGTEFPVRTWMRIFVKVRNRCMIACKSS